MTLWDRRTFFRALVAAALGLAVAWLVTAASDEGQLTVSARAGRTLPLAPVASAVGAALALGTSRVRQETRALEAIGRPPSHAAAVGAVGASVPSLVIALAIGLSSSLDVSGFYPRPPSGDGFVADGDAFVSTALGVTVEADGTITSAAAAEPGRSAEGELPRGARLAAAVATGAAGLALSLVTAGATLRPGLLGRVARRRRRYAAGAQIAACAIATLLAFQIAAAGFAPAIVAAAPPLALLAFAARRTALGRSA